MNRFGQKEKCILKQRFVCKVLMLTFSFMLVFTLIPLLAYEEGYFASAATDTCEQNGSWGEWSTTVPAAGAKYESRTEYRYKDRKTITDTSKPAYYIVGYTESGSSSTGTYTDYGSWSGWTVNPYSSSTTRQVETKTTYRYYRWKCGTCYDCDPFGGACSHCGASGLVWSESYFDQSPSSLGYETSNYWTGRGRVVIGGLYWWFELDGVDNGMGSTGQPKRTEYRYRDRHPYYNYYYWRTDWTDWSTTAATASADKKVETRTTYRVWIPGAHTWDAGRVTKAAGYTYNGVSTHTCSVCGASMDSAIPSLDASAVTPMKVALTSAKVSGKKVTLVWKKVAYNTQGYQIAIKNKKTQNVKYYNANASSKSKIKKKVKLKKGTYAVMVRAYNVINGETIYGPWSRVKAGKVK